MTLCFAAPSSIIPSQLLDHMSSGLIFAQGLINARDPKTWACVNKNCVKNKQLCQLTLNVRRPDTVCVSSARRKARTLARVV